LVPLEKRKEVASAGRWQKNVRRNSMSEIYTIREQAEQEWADLHLREKVAAIDPDGDRELLMEFIDWCKEDNVAKHVRSGIIYNVLAWLDATGQSTRWIEEREQEIKELREPEFTGEVF
jgi:hypothetical protein